MFRAARYWLGRNYWIVMVVAGAILASLTTILYFWDIGRGILALVERLQRAAASPDPNSEDFRNLATAIAVLLATLAAVTTLAFQLARVWTTERQTRTAEQGHITDRINKAVENLGADKTVWRDGKQATEPNLEVRLGGIYALERISQDSPRDHVQIMEILCAYGRHNAPTSGAADFPLPDWQVPIWKNDPDDRAAFRVPRFGLRKRFDRPAPNPNLRDWSRALPPPRQDIQTALTVLGRRGPEGKEREATATRGARLRLDLHGANLQRAELAGCDLSHADLRGARLEGANLSGARLRHALLHGAHADGADFSGAEMQSLHFPGGCLEGADLSDAGLEGADLTGAQMEAGWLHRTRLAGATLREARLECALLIETRVEGADAVDAFLAGAEIRRTRLARAAGYGTIGLVGAGFHDCDLSDKRSMALAQAFGSLSVTLPDGYLPDEQPLIHWNRKKLDILEFYYHWRGWQHTTGFLAR